MRRGTFAGLLALIVLLLSSCGPETRPQAEGGDLLRAAVQYADRSAIQASPVRILKDLPELKVAEVLATERELHQLRQHPGVLLIEPVSKRQLFYSEESPGQGWHVPAMGLERAWATTRGCGVRVAVLDSWPDARHPDLAKNIEPGFDAFTRKEIQPDEAEPGLHGTHVAGLVAANGRVKGAAPCAKILPVQVFKGAEYVGDVGAAEGLVWAVDHGAQVINLSWGGAGYSVTLARAIEYALRKGAIVVAAAGNEGGPFPSYPAAYPGVITVSALTGTGALASFSSYGYFADLAAPGVRILSTLPHGDYGYLSGTSMASPLVAGSTALLLARHPEADGWQIVKTFQETASPVPGHEELRAVHTARALEASLPPAGGCLKIWVRSSNGKGVRLADLKLVSASGRVYWAKTDGAGEATLYNLEPGNYTIQAAGPEWPDLKAEERVIATAEARAIPSCQAVDLVLKSDVVIEIAWFQGDVDLAIKEGNWPWTTAKEGARFGAFETGDATDGGLERYRFLGGLSEATLRYGAKNLGDSPVEVEVHVSINGWEDRWTVTLPPDREIHPFGEARVLGKPEYR